MRESLKKPQTCEHRDIKKRMRVKSNWIDLHGQKENKGAKGDMNVSSPARCSAISIKLEGGKFHRLLQEYSL